MHPRSPCRAGTVKGPARRIAASTGLKPSFESFWGYLAKIWPAPDFATLRGEQPELFGG